MVVASGMVEGAATTVGAVRAIGHLPQAKGLVPAAEAGAALVPAGMATMEVGVVVRYREGRQVATTARTATSVGAVMVGRAAGIAKAPG